MDWISGFSRRLKASKLSEYCPACWNLLVYLVCFSDWDNPRCWRGCNGYRHRRIWPWFGFCPIRRNAVVGKEAWCKCWDFAWKWHLLCFSPWNTGCILGRSVSGFDWKVLRWRDTRHVFWTHRRWECGVKYLDCILWTKVLCLLEFMHRRPIDIAWI